MPCALCSSCTGRECVPGAHVRFSSCSTSNASCFGTCPQYGHAHIHARTRCVAARMRGVVLAHRDSNRATCGSLTKRRTSPATTCRSAASRSRVHFARCAAENRTVTFSMLSPAREGEAVADKTPGTEQAGCRAAPPCTHDSILVLHAEHRSPTAGSHHMSSNLPAFNTVRHWDGDEPETTTCRKCTRTTT